MSRPPVLTDRLRTSPVKKPTEKSTRKPTDKPEPLVDLCDQPPPEDQLGGGDICSLQEQPSTEDDKPLD